MREILFRGKRVDNGEWVYGMPCATRKSGIYAIQTFDGGIFDIIPESISEFTGLTDKNGKKIFEGDIVRENYGKIVYNHYEVVSMDSWRCGWFPFARGDGCGCCQVDTWSIGCGEVIGNIHDNPELLEER